VAIQRVCSCRITITTAPKGYKVNEGGLRYNNGACTVRDYSQDWVRFGVDWQPDHIAWYIDGVKRGEFTDATKIENGPCRSFCT